VLFNAATGYFVMFLHIDSPDYAEARLGFARSTSLTGPYEYLGSSRPMGNSSRDIGVYQEPSGLGVLMSEDRENGLHLYRLASDYLSIESVLSMTLKNDGSHGYESPALVCVDGLYYLFGSDLTGWNMNDNKYATANSLEGPWSEWRDFALPGSRTFDSQISTVVPVLGSNSVSHVYIGDRWNQHDHYNSLPVILPISIGGGHASLIWREEWELD
jgi:beta-xylosidase